jgi:hypothetical protein
MMYDKSATPLIEQLRAASDAEGVAIRALLAYMKPGGNDSQKLGELTDQMTAAGAAKMRIVRELEPYRLDK